MNPSIPASEIVAVNPSVIGAGGAEISLNGLVLTTSTRVFMRNGIISGRSLMITTLRMD